MCERTLRGIWEGGVHDHVGGGIARYSVDERVRSKANSMLHA